MFKEKTAYFKQNINSKINEPKTLWKNLKSTVLPPKNDNLLPSHFDNADEINNHFLNVPGSTTVPISVLTFFEFHLYTDKVFSLQPVRVDTVGKIINRLKSNAEGSDGITLNMILMTLPWSLEAITEIVNRSISTSTFPDAHKVAIVRPLPKVNNPNVVWLQSNAS